MTRDVLLSVENLVVGTRDADGREVRLVDGVSFQIAEGEVLCVVGESGSGKSLTMAAVLGLLPAGVEVLSGRVDYRGEDLLAAGERRLRELRGRRLAMVFQDPMTALNPVKRVGAQIARAVRRHGNGVSRAEADRRAAALLSAVGVPDAAARARAYPHQWSGACASAPSSPPRSPTTPISWWPTSPRRRSMSPSRRRSCSCWPRRDSAPVRRWP